MRYLPLLLVLLIALSACSGDEPGVDPEAGSYLNWGPEASYIGKSACAECHRDNHDSFVQAQMGRSFKPATATLSDADWMKDTPILDADRGLYYQPVRKGEELFVREFRLAGSDTVHNRLEKIDWIVGSGQHTNSHMREVNGYLYQIPLTWYAQRGVWGLPPGFDGGDSPRFDRPVPDQCMACHDGPSTFIAGSENRFEDIPHGIECENCHGPGSVHDDAIRAGRVVNVEEDIDYTIVHPRKLSVERQDDLCRRCHMQGATVMRQGVSPFDYRPGQPLTDYLDVFWPRFADSSARFIMASHPDRMQMSACFRETRIEARGLPPMTCITCHNPHKDVQEKTPFEYNAPCRACHSRPDIGACQEAPAVREAAEDDCSSCHMPKSGTIDIPNVQVTDHYIRTVRPVPSSALRENRRTDLVRMAPLLRDSVSAEVLAEGYLTYYEEFAHREFLLDSAAVVLGRSVTHSNETRRVRIRLEFLRDDWPALLETARGMIPVDTVDPWTAYRIGEAFLSTEVTDDAILWFERARTLAPDHLRFLERLGGSYLTAGRPQEAIATFNEVLIRNPTVATSRNNRGFAYLLVGDLVAGEADVAEALALSPDLPEALGTMASLLLNTERAAEAEPFAKRLLDLDPENLEYRQFYSAVATAAAGR